MIEAPGAWTPLQNGAPAPPVNFACEVKKKPGCPKWGTGFLLVEKLTYP